LTDKFTNLYRHGQRLNSLCKKFFTEFKNAEERDDQAMMICYGEALRKVTMNTVEIAKTVLGVEDLLKGKRVLS